MYSIRPHNLMFCNSSACFTYLARYTSHVTRQVTVHGCCNYNLAIAYAAASSW